ncbi:MAG: amidohydrolase [Paludibacteraceae bacterium]|nr:amidohydrolase [Paludibacteraceae bacterium]
MKQYLMWTVCLLLAASCSGPKNVSPQDVAETLKLKDYEPVSVFRLEEHHPSAAKFSAIDFHSHAYRKDEAGIREWVKTLDDNNIEKVIVYTYAFGEEFDRLYDLFTGISDKFEVWCGLDMTKWDQPEFPDCALKELERCHAKGAGGVGELSDKGMGERISRSVREPGLHFNDPKFDALFEKCGELGMPVTIHNGDPIWMYEPLDAHNDGYMNAKEWWIDLSTPGMLDLDGVIEAFEECVARHPNTTFIACHLININHDYARLGTIMDRHPNLWIDISARHQETCITPRATKRFYEKYQDRILFGTDNDPVTEMYHDQWRILETEDEHFYLKDQSYHWPMQGIGLSDDVLHKIYHDNAIRLLSSRNR